MQACLLAMQRVPLKPTRCCRKAGLFLTSELAHVREGVLQSICQLEGVHIAQPELHIGIHHQLGKAQDLRWVGRRGQWKGLKVSGYRGKS